MSPEAEVAFVDLNDFNLPIYSIDRERASGIPQAARSFFDLIGAAEAVLVSFAEHNGTVTSAWKNLFDWMSRIDRQVWQGKPVVFLAASPGPRAGAGVLGHQAQLAPFFGPICAACKGSAHGAKLGTPRPGRSPVSRTSRRWTPLSQDWSRNRHAKERPHEPEVKRAEACHRR